MNSTQLHRGQYLISRSGSADLGWSSHTMAGYTVQHHPDLSLTRSTKGTDLILLGEIFSWSKPEMNNQDITDLLADRTELPLMLDLLDSFGGQFLLLVALNDELTIVPDACAQLECYYSEDGEIAATQVKLFDRIAQNKRDDDPEKTAYYASEAFKKRKLHILDQTHMAGVKKLLPNEYINLNSRQVSKRFPPAYEPMASEDVAQTVAAFFRGFMRALSHRFPLIMGVTAGYDSRVLFLASTDLDIHYYVSRHSWMADDHYDLTIPQLLCDSFNKELEVIQDTELDDEKSPEYLASLDFPRAKTGRSGKHSEKVFVNGNVSEIARNYFGNLRGINAADLAYLNGFGSDAYVIQQYENWLSENRNELNALGYNELDFFYWEEKMGNWGVKAKTEWAALGERLYSPFNCRELLLTLLSSPRKDRDAYNNRLYEEIFNELGQPFAIPVNPGKKERIIRLMKYFRVYDLYRKLGIRFRFLKV